MIRTSERDSGVRLQYAVGMTVAKIAISLPPHALARARRAVRSGEAPSVSVFIARAIEQQTSREDLRRMLGGMLEETGGPVSAAEKREIDRELGVAPRSRARTKA